MTGEQRRTEIRRMLLDAQQPMTGTALAKGLHVSRQVIVQDIALMRAEQTPILSTNKGYLLRPDDVQFLTVTALHILPLKQFSLPMKKSEWLVHYSLI